MDGAFMEPSGRNRWQPVANGTRSKNRSNRPMLSRASAVGCHPAGGPFPAEEGVDTDRRSLRLLLVAALRAWALVATAAGACLADHGPILPGSSFGRLRSRGSVATA